MSVRPSSSRGLSSKSSAAASFKYDKRISRDDSFVNLRTGAGAGFKPHAFTRGQLPTPEISPRSSPSRKTSIPTIRMPTPESLNEYHSAEIGMALGSPRDMPTTYGSSRTPQAAHRAYQASTTSLVSTAPGASTTDLTDKPLRRKQSGKWNLFSRFGKKSSDHSHSGQGGQKGAQILEHPTDTASQRKGETKVERSHTITSRGTPKHKPIVVRSQTMPFDTEHPPRPPKSTPNEKKANEAHGLPPMVLGSKPDLSGPLLDVEIPRITMERYSVMFGSVLQPQPPPLLARRQATVEKLKTVDDAAEKEEAKKHREIARRETSPANTSPSLALFPNPPKKPVQASSHPTSRLRSNTSPALLPSPSKATFDHPMPNRQKPSDDGPQTGHRKVPSGHRVQKDKLTIATLARAREQEAGARERQFSPNSSNLLLDSPADLLSPESEVIKTEPVRPKASYIQEPKWQMVTPAQQTPPTASSTAASDKKKPPPSPALSTLSDFSETSQDDMFDDGPNMNPVELSIARQISISRQQRKLLKPMQTGLAPSHRQRSTSKPVPKIAVGQNERYVEAKTSTATVVIPEEPSGSPQAQYRKSERVVLDLA